MSKRVRGGSCWSGAAHHLDAEAERVPFIDAGLEPWVAGVPAHFIRVNPVSIWGNRTRRA